MDEYVFENIKRLETPVGYFSITDGEKEMPFSVKKCTYTVNIYGYDNKLVNIKENVSAEKFWRQD